MSAFACPVCGFPSAVKDSRARGGNTYRRRRCPNGHRFTTTELVGNPHETKKYLGLDDVLDLRELDEDQRAAFKAIYQAIARPMIQAPWG